MRNKGFAQVLILLIIVLVGIGGYLAYKGRSIESIFNKYFPKQTETHDVFQVQPDWKEYRSLKTGLVFRYPPEYSPTIPFKLAWTINTGNEFSVSELFNFDSKKLYLCKTFEEKLCLIPGENQGQEKDIQPISLAGKNAISFFVSMLDENQHPRVLHIIQTAEKPFIEVVFATDWTGGKEMFQSILSTFKFTDQDTSVQIPGWKYYMNNDFSFQYPGEWKIGQGGAVIVSDVGGANVNIFAKDAPMYNECMKLDKTEAINSLIVKYYSYAFTPEACSNESNRNNKEAWITKASGDGFQPGILYAYNTTFYPNSINVFQQILSTFQFTN